MHGRFGSVTFYDTRPGNVVGFLLYHMQLMSAQSVRSERDEGVAFARVERLTACTPANV